MNEVPVILRCNSLFSLFIKKISGCRRPLKTFQAIFAPSKHSYKTAKIAYWQTAVIELYAGFNLLFGSI